MKYSPKNYSLKTGETVTIRTPRPEEAQALIDLKLDYLHLSKSLPMFPEEYKNSEAEEKELILKYQNGKNSILLVAEANGQLIGNIDLTESDRKKMAHTAMLGMSIKSEWRNKGLGTVLMNASLEWAREASTLEIIWLEVYANNFAGLNLYKKSNFKVSGTIERFFKEGLEYVDKIMMYQSLK